MGDSLRAAFSKAMASLPDQRRRRYESVLNRIVVGVPPHPDLVLKSADLSHDVYTEVERAVLGSFRLRFDYVDVTGRASSRDVEPHGMLVQAPLWYLLAYDWDGTVPGLSVLTAFLKPPPMRRCASSHKTPVNCLERSPNVIWNCWSEEGRPALISRNAWVKGLGLY